MKGVGEAGRYNRCVSLVIDDADAQAMPAATPKRTRQQATPQSDS